MKKYLVFDIGGTFIKYSIMNEENIFTKGKIKTPQDSLESLIDSLDTIAKNHITEIEGIAVSMPGVIDSERGYALHGGALTYIKNTNIKELIQSRFNLPVSIENDGKSAALGEHWKGKLKNVDFGVMAVIGTGIGGGIISSGKLLKGFNYAAGEFSGLRLDQNNPKDDASTFGYCGSAPRLVANIAKNIGEDIDSFTGEDMYEVINKGNKTAIDIFNKYCKDFSVQILNLQAILDPEIFVIGGGISANPILVERINENIDKIVENDYIYNLTKIKPKVVRSELGNDANLYGALYSFFKQNKIEFEF